MFQKKLDKRTENSQRLPMSFQHSEKIPGHSQKYYDYG